ncbi:hypothetical protein GLYMA_03G138100v4 [Glycine max]|uniref:Remorin C-terminal domain-containing protein n=1 Tax=Glycine max TaxID=3847 RepID=K7KEX2_SOYBN|nr:hypothetical protein GYH30_007165 [Glycine max]KRH66963.1 hypothetical protein GLYMA_03G138100v4 [Glycine max]
MNNEYPTIIASTTHGSLEEQEDEHITEIREIHELTPPPPRGRAWETVHHTHRSSSLSVASEGGASSSDNFSMSREFSALVLAGSCIDHDNNNISPMNENNHNNNSNSNSLLGRIREEDLMEETNPLAIVPDNHPLQDPVPSSTSQGVRGGGGGAREEHVSVQMVKKEEVDAKISAWQNAKINNRFKREDAVINGWESEQVQKASSWMKKVEKLKYFSSLNRSRLA